MVLWRLFVYCVNTNHLNKQIIPFVEPEDSVFVCYQTRLTLYRPTFCKLTKRNFSRSMFFFNNFFKNWSQEKDFLLGLLNFCDGKNNCRFHTVAKVKEDMKQFSWFSETLLLLKSTILFLVNYPVKQQHDALLKKLLTLYLNSLGEEQRALFGRYISWNKVFEILKEKNIVLTSYKNFFYQKWLATPVAPFLDQVSNLENTKDSIIYIIFSTKTRLFYIGETKNLRSRIMRG